MELMHAAHVPAGEGPFPTVIALHGWGANAHDLLGLAPYLHGGEALVLCPQGPVVLDTGGGAQGYGWFPITSGGPPDPAAFDEGRAAAAHFLDAAVAAYPVDMGKLVVLGFSQGGVMAYDLALGAPQRFAGLAALSSWLPDPLAARVAGSPGLDALHAFVCHGTEDPMIPVAMGQQSRDALLGLGVPTTYREYGMGHEIRPETLHDLVDWLETQVFAPIRPA
ncbi:MAG: alpha/beta hydrolase-fold protein [Myxococcota bacterium]|jgi:phospholipase/carboxylesterase|nr:phospholipase [Deltaproteobacteria bacterium]MDP6076533.1 alpha/beta hydrolase-fold protein [Myxococcota bacterium]MDP6243008.1 alpha/beta hydrolase-fold protein [Myxococcota bacterium]MDP7075713.1 alpha/beta hydrolase-fold protein [Myxococcota bacterium]MDP7297941.1 alpha/beta hydrolase-fold protein [Myxococcota bacterium]